MNENELAVALIGMLLGSFWVLAIISTISLTKIANSLEKIVNKLDKLKG